MSQSTEFVFQGVRLEPVPGMTGVWFTAAQISYALEYADDRAVQRIYTRHADEFTEQMTGVVKLTTPGGEQPVRVFSLRGSHLIAMFSRTPKAKEFRRWILDILDREVLDGNVTPIFSGGVMLNFEDGKLVLSRVAGPDEYLMSVKTMIEIVSEMR